MVLWWQDPAIQPTLSLVYKNWTFFLLGVYGWEYVQSFGVEYAVLRGRLPFRWPLVPYLVGRTCLLIALVMTAIELSPFVVYLSCETAIVCAAVSADIAIGTCSTNLMIRTWVIWKNSRWVHILLSLTALGQWAILITSAVSLRSFRSNGVCLLDLTRPEITAGVFLYTTCYDFLVLALSIMKLSKKTSTSTLKGRLYTQGILYFCVAAMANVVPTVFAFLGCDVLVGITASFAMTASTIVSCRAVRSLLGLRTSRQSDACDPDAHGELEVTLTTHLPNQPSITLVYT